MTHQNYHQLVTLRVMLISYLVTYTFGMVLLGKMLVPYRDLLDLKEKPV
jgi:hypothetical protein